jgi:hypothetical protein
VNVGLRRNRIVSNVLSLLRPVGGKHTRFNLWKDCRSDELAKHTASSPEDLVGPETIRMGTGRSEAIVGNVVLALSRLITSFYCFFCQISEKCCTRLASLRRTRKVMCKATTPAYLPSSNTAFYLSRSHLGLDSTAPSCQDIPHRWKRHLSETWGFGRMRCLRNEQRTIEHGPCSTVSARYSILHFRERRLFLTSDNENQRDP